MRTKGDHKINIVTMGCSKNLVDSEVLLTQLKGNDLNAYHESQQDADVVIVNTCGFIDMAKQESIDTILHYAKSKKRGELQKLYVTGCLSERYRHDLKNEIPEVDAFFGTHDLPQLLKKFNADYKHELLGERIATTQHYAYLKISEGCDRPCSFCAIPLMRGKHRSRPIEELVEETRHLAARGVKEILIIAQDSTFYGIDLYGKRKLARLLEQLSEVEGIEWIRLHYAFPTGFPEDVLDVMASKPNICNYLDIPLQHASDKMLKVMRRGTTRKKTEKLIRTIRDKVPGVAIRTTVIVGHPGEQPEDFQELTEFISDIRFDRMGVFQYSHEEQTHSYSMEDHIPAKVKQERADIVMQQQETISIELNRQKIGQCFKVLVDKKEGDFYVGRTEFDSPEVDNEVLIQSKNKYLRIGDFTTIKVTDASEFDIYGIPV